VAGGALRIHARLQALLQAHGLEIDLVLDRHEDAGHDLGAGVGLKKSGCHGFCEMGPLLRIEPENWLYVKVTEADCEEIIEQTVLRGAPVSRLLYTNGEGTFAVQEEIPFYRRQTRVVLEHCGSIDAESLTEYLAKGGYAAFKKALVDMTPEDICREVAASNLRGRGGGGYPAGRKWQQVLRNDSDVKYVVCNGDEAGEDVHDRLIRYDRHGLMVEQTLVFVPEQRLAVLILRNVTEEIANQERLQQVREQTVEIAQKVIDKQMRVAQEIASLLGETTAETKVALTRLKKSILAGEGMHA
jgi:NADH-quinone oxidoreductase subunit F